MDSDDIPYLLKRACAHRLLAHEAKCCEARSIHRTFVRNYQRRLVAVRRSRVGQPGFAMPAPVGEANYGQQQSGLFIGARSDGHSVLWAKASIEEIPA